MAAVGVALRARLHAGLAADAARGVDEERELAHRMPPAAGSSAAIVVRPASGAFDTRTAQTLNSGIFEIGSSARIVQLFADRSSGQWYGMNTVSGRMVFTTCARHDDRAAAALDADEVAVGDAELPGQPRMDLAPRLGILVDERRRCGGSGCRTGTATRPGRWSGRSGTRRHGSSAAGRHSARLEMRLAVGVAELAALVQPRRARMVERRARPEDAHLAVDRS